MKGIEGDTYLTVMNASTRTIREIAEELRQLGNAFKTTGNSEMSSKLLTISYDLAITQKDISTAVKKELDRNLADAREMSSTVLKTALAMTERR